MPDTPEFRGLAPTSLVADVERTAVWYRDNLGFTIGDYSRVHHHDHDSDRDHI